MTGAVGIDHLLVYLLCICSNFLIIWFNAYLAGTRNIVWLWRYNICQIGMNISVGWWKQTLTKGGVCNILGKENYEDMRPVYTNSSHTNYMFFLSQKFKYITMHPMPSWQRTSLVEIRASLHRKNIYGVINNPFRNLVYLVTKIFKDTSGASLFADTPWLWRRCHYNTSYYQTTIQNVCLSNMKKCNNINAVNYHPDIVIDNKRIIDWTRCFLCTERHSALESFAFFPLVGIHLYVIATVCRKFFGCFEGHIFT